MRRIGILREIEHTKRDCSTVTGANPRIVRREQEGSTSDPLNDDESAPNSANGSIPSMIAWIEPKPPGNAATVSFTCTRGSSSSFTTFENGAKRC